MKIRHVMLGALALPALGLLAIGAFLAWGNRPVPQDLRLEAVTLVETKSIGIDDPWLTALADRTPALLRLDLSTSGKLGTRALNEDMNVWSRASQCDEGSGARDIYARGPYFGRLLLPLGSRVDGDALEQAERAAGDRHTYSVYIIPKGEAGTVADINDRGPYDLRTLSGPLCIRIGAGSMAFTGFRTNVVRVPEEQLLAALSSSRGP
ncbi:MAG TPA: hypothetical protein PLF78_06850 [Caulobacter sp.]|nr:hypothetical protein [Caulobacter sp.]